MYETLKQFCKTSLPFSEDELNLVDRYFEEIILKKKEFLFQDGTRCDFVAFIAKGSIRQFYLKDGVEKTCDISIERSWVTDFKSFTSGKSGTMNLQAIEETYLLLIRKNKLAELYTKCDKYETFGRLMIEEVAQRATDIAMSLSSDTAEERVNNLLRSQPELFQRIPQKYIANFLGISPETLSRTRARILQKQKS